MPKRIRTDQPAVTLRDITAARELDLLSGWRPPDGEYERSRAYWFTWSEFLSTYESVRIELAERFADRDVSLSDPEQWPFAERALQFRNDRGLHALEAADYQTIAAYCGRG